MSYSSLNISGNSETEIRKAFNDLIFQLNSSSTDIITLTGGTSIEKLSSSTTYLVNSSSDTSINIISRGGASNAGTKITLINKGSGVSSITWSTDSIASTAPAMLIKDSCISFIWDGVSWLPYGNPVFGYNSNGYYKLYSDGSIEQYGKLTSSIAISTVYGTYYYGQTTISIPITDSTFVYSSATAYTTNQIFDTNIASTTVSTIVPRLSCIVPGITGTFSFTIQWYHLGNWK